MSDAELVIMLNNSRDATKRLASLNAELLVSLIHMEYWARCFAKPLNANNASKIGVRQNLDKAQRVIAKAEEIRG